MISFVGFFLFNTSGQWWRRGTKCDCKTDWLWFRFPVEEMKYFLKFIVPCLCSGVEDKRGVEFCHCVQNSAESGVRSVSTLGSLCLPCNLRDTAWSWLITRYNLLWSVVSMIYFLLCYFIVYFPLIKKSGLILVVLYLIGFTI